MAAIDGTTLFWITVAALGLVGSSICSGVEMGFYSLNRIRLNLRAAEPDAPASLRLLKRESDQSDRFLANILVGNNLFNYIGALGVTALLERTGYGDAALIALNALVLTPVLLVFGESVPKEIFRVRANRLTRAFTPPLTVMRIALTITGVIPLVTLFARTVGRAVGAGPEAGFDRDERRRIAELLKEGAAHGALSESQSTLVDRALAFQSATVADHMVPWARAVTLNANVDRLQLAAAVNRSGHTAFPVLDDRGRVLGVLHAGEALSDTRTPLRTMLRKPSTLRPDTPPGEALTILRNAHSHLAVVVSAPGSSRPIGLFTPRDMINPLVGRVASK